MDKELTMYIWPLQHCTRTTEEVTRLDFKCEPELIWEAVENSLNGFEGILIVPIYNKSGGRIQTLWITCRTSEGNKLAFEKIDLNRSLLELWPKKNVPK